MRIIGCQRPKPRSAELPGRRFRAALLGATLLASTACYDQVVGPVEESDDRITITNDEEALAERIRYLDEEVPIDPTNAASRGSVVSGIAPAPGLAPSAIALTLIAEVDPPTIDGEVVQATAVSGRTVNAFLVSYNVRGETFLGGLDYVINWVGTFPTVLSSVAFNDSDVSAVALEGASIFAAQGTNATGFATPASIERLGLGFFGVQLQNSMRHDLSSFAATSVQSINNDIYVTTGDDGHLYALDPSDLSIRGEYALDDARWVAHDNGGGNGGGGNGGGGSSRIVVVQGTPGRIAVFEDGSFPGGSMTLLNSFPFPGADVPESKSSMDIAGGKAFIAAGREGVQIMCLDDGQIVGTVPRPDPVALGLPDDVVVTNAVTVDDDLMFISNGEAGVYVAAGADAWADTACDAPQSITVLGHLRFEDFQSANHVDYRDGVLFVAAGLGGLKIVNVAITP